MRGVLMRAFRSSRLFSRSRVGFLKEPRRPRERRQHRLHGRFGARTGGPHPADSRLVCRLAELFEAGSRVAPDSRITVGGGTDQGVQQTNLERPALWRRARKKLGRGGCRSTT